MNSPKEFSADYLKYLSSLLEKLSNEDIARFINQILDVRENNRKIFFIGNGGSASTASHFVNDISLESRQFENPFKAISLCDNQAVITAIANDDGYENIFLQQLQTQADAGDTLVPGSVEETGFCGSGTQRTTTGICQNIVKSTIPVQGIGGQGGDGAGWRYTAPYVGGAPQEETLGQDGTDNACGVCPPGTNLQGGNCSSVGGRGGDGGDWGEGGGSTLPLESGEPHDAGKGGSAICGLNPDTNQKNWVVSGTISDQTLKGEYQLGGCDGTAGDQPPVPSPAIVTVSKPHYIRFGDAAGNGTDGYGADGAANLLVTAPPDSAFGSICNFRIKYNWLDAENRAGTHMTGMEVGGKRFGLPSGTWYISANNPVGGATRNVWSQFMQKYAIFPGDPDYFTGARAYVRLFERYPIETLTDEVHQLRYRFTIPTNNNNFGYRLYAQADNHASFSIGKVGETTSQLGEVAEFSNPGEFGDVLDVTYSGTDPRFQPGEYFLDVTIKNSSFPPGHQYHGTAKNNDWFYNPGGVAFVLLNLQSDNFNNRLDRDADDNSETGGYPDYMVSSRNLNSINYYNEGSYNKWIRVGWALKNTDSRLFLTWLKLNFLTASRKRTLA